MISAALIVVLLAATASFASWLFSQWLGIRRRSTATIVTLGGAGVTLLIGAAAMAILAAPTWWQTFIPAIDPAPTLLAPVAEGTAANRQAAAPPTQTAVEDGSSASAVDAAMKSAQLAIQSRNWPATDCVTSTRSSAAAGGWFIDNECDRVVAVVFAWCQQKNVSCNGNALRTQAWRYEPKGIVMTSALQRPSRQRLGDTGPLVAPTYALNAAGDAQQRIRYLACYVTAPDALEVLAGSRTDTSDAEQQRRLDAALSSDECYERVSQWSRLGQQQGKSPDALLSDGV
jgi:hypothetical protein